MLFNEMAPGKRVGYPVLSDENSVQAFQPADFLSFLLGGHMVFLCPSVGNLCLYNFTGSKSLNVGGVTPSLYVTGSGKANK